MTNRWEYGEEYLTLQSAFRQAQQSGDRQRCKELQPRLKELHVIMWQSMTVSFPQLLPYETLADALHAACHALKLPFPDLTRANIRTGDNIFLFDIADEARTVQILPRQSSGYYKIEIFTYEQPHEGRCYSGETASLEEVATALSYWFVERYDIEKLHDECPWISLSPFIIRETPIS